MPYSSGTYSLPSGNPVVTGTTISSSTTNTTNSDIATALSTCVLKDGTQTITANLPMASHKLTGLSAGTTAGDSVEYGGSPSFTNLAYTGTLTGSTGILNIGSGQLYKGASGNVGIGTSSPSGKTHIYTTAAVGAVNQASSALNIENTPGDPMMILTGASGGIIASMTSAQAATPMRFYTGNTERMRIDSSGNVGIGTSVPSKKLEVYATANSLQIESIVRNDQAGSGVAAIGFNVSSSAASETTSTKAGIGLVRTSAYGVGSLVFYNNATASAGDFTTADEKMRIDSSGNLLVGTTSGSYKITCNGQPGANGYTAWTNYSDQRLKENITDFKGGLKEVLNLSPKSFNYNELSGYDEDTRARTVSGFIAQELELVCPEMVGTTEINGVEYLDTNTSNLNLLLIKAIQELKAIIDTQQEQINSLLGK